MAKNYERVDAVVDEEGWIVSGEYSRWDCEVCEREVRRYRGSSSASCHECGAQYSISGQRYRDDWRENPSWKYGDCDDMEGFEISQLAKEARA